MLSSWFRVIRVKFLLASVIAVCLGLAINWWQNQTIDLVYAGLTFVGVIALHASVDLLNDYWDFKRDIDTKTKRTKFSGGTGVLPEGLLQPNEVYRVGLIFLIIGSSVGGYFIFEKGITIAVILAFAIISIYFYSTKIVNSGLGEIFVAIKGSMIVLGTFFVQTSHITMEPILGGIVVGILSSLVLFVNSFPDFDADKAGGRKTLVIMLGKKKASNAVWIFPIIVYGIIVSGIVLHVLPILSLITLFTIPLLIKSGLRLKQNFDDIDKIVPTMGLFVSYSRITGLLLVLSFLFLSK
ncbi:MAG: prenyltransferase [Thaumarchaeota archaeon]|nr:MAG: prenyltransferase [Nitrososphaerota archaeon]TLX83651.1 MAG: prenyltransferase [Nitrososphaerota archaeon]